MAIPVASRREHVSAVSLKKMLQTDTCLVQTATFPHHWTVFEVACCSNGSFVGGANDVLFRETANKKKRTCLFAPSRRYGSPQKCRPGWRHGAQAGRPFGPARSRSTSLPFLSDSPVERLDLGWNPGKTTRLANGYTKQTIFSNSDCIFRVS